MKRTATLALALLFLFPACSRQAKDDAYHWVPPEKKIAQTAGAKSTSLISCCNPAQNAKNIT